MPVFTIHHITRYRYDRPVKESVNRVRIFPLVDDRQQVLQAELLLKPSAQVVRFTDGFGNETGDFNVLEPHRELVIDSRIVVRTLHRQGNPLESQARLTDLQPLISNDVGLLQLAEPERIEQQALIRQMLKELPPCDDRVAALAQACSEYIFRHFSYVKGITTVETTVDEILEHRSGVCQDFAHVLLQMLRTLGIPARYVSGYICPNQSGLRGEGATHAWVEYFLPGEGWVGLDPTNNVPANGQHVRLAVGSHFGDCTPVKGTFRGLAQQQLTVFVSVGYEDGHTFEGRNEVEQESDAVEGTEPWQDELIAQQQQQQ